MVPYSLKLKIVKGVSTTLSDMTIKKNYSTIRQFWQKNYSGLHTPHSALLCCRYMVGWRWTTPYAWPSSWLLFTRETWHGTSRRKCWSFSWYALWWASSRASAPHSHFGLALLRSCCIRSLWFLFMCWTSSLDGHRSITPVVEHQMFHFVLLNFFFKEKNTLLVNAWISKQCGSKLRNKKK